MRRPGIILPVYVALCAPALGDDKPVSGDAARSFEEVLSGKGLKRYDVSYILKDTDERNAKARGIAEELERLEDQFRPLLQRRERLVKAVEGAEKNINNPKGKDDEQEERNVRRARIALDEAKNELTAFRSQYGPELERYDAEKRRIQKASIELGDETKRLYDRLMRDPEVRKAIRAHNRERRPKVVLGPVASPQEYGALIRADDFQLLREKGIVLDPRRNRSALADQLALADELKVVSLVYKAQVALEQIKKAEKPVRPGGRTKAEARTEFLVVMRDLLRTAAEAGQRRKLVDADQEVKDTILELVGNPRQKGPRARVGKVPEALNYRQALRSKAELEKSIRLESIPQQVGPDQRPMISARFEGGHVAKMAIDPDATLTILPGSLAAAVGAKPSDDAPEVVVRGLGGVKVDARRSAIPFVQLGSLKVDRVPCVVLPANVILEPIPVIGNDVFDQLGAHVGPDNTVVLMEFVPAATNVANGRGANRGRRLRTRRRSSPPPWRRSSGRRGPR